MSIFNRKPKLERYQLHKVYITYEVLVNAKNEIHAVNLVKEVREDMWSLTRKYIGKFSMSETTKAKKT